MRRRFAAVLTFVLACVFLTGCGDQTTSPEQEGSRDDRSRANAASDGPGDTPDEPAAPADPAPDFEVQTFDGETFALGEQRGTPVVLNFWESW